MGRTPLASALAALILLTVWCLYPQAPDGGSRPSSETAPAAAESALATDRAAPEPDAQLLRLQAQVQRLSARVEQLERAGSSDGLAVSNLEAVPDGPDGADPVEQRQARQQRVADAFEGGSPDAERGEQLAEDLAELLAAREDASEVHDVACTDDLCRIVVESEDGPSANALAEELVMLPGLPRATLGYEPHGERVRITAHFAREQHELPL
jgi:hypothetical protein